MITVRFPSGFSVQYNDLNYVKWGGDVVHLYRDSTSTGWSVTVPQSCIIELMRPCRTYHAAEPSVEVQNELSALRKKIASLTRKLAKVSK